MITTERQFAKECCKRGFYRRGPRYYIRCIGDGIFQTIFTGFKKYIEVDSSEIRKSYYISIGFCSLYSYYDERLFSEESNAGGYKPADLCYRCKHCGPFAGITEDYEYMEREGFDILDEITTQEKLLEWWDRVQTIDTGRRIHDLALAEPMLLCRKADDAAFEISTNFIQGILAYTDYLDHVECGFCSENSDYVQRIMQSARRELQLWRWVNGRNRKALNRYLSDNYQRNLEWVQKYGIPTDLLTPPRTLEEGYYLPKHNP